MAEEMVVFTRCYDLLAWLVPKVETFPRAFRFNVVDRLVGAALDMQEALLDAQCERASGRAAALRRADASLAKVKLYLRLAHHWQWLTVNQYEHVSRMANEIGRLIGGWVKQTSRQKDA